MGDMRPDQGGVDIALGLWFVIVLALWFAFAFAFAFALCVALPLLLELELLPNPMLITGSGSGCSSRSWADGLRVARPGSKSMTGVRQSVHHQSGGGEVECRSGEVVDGV
jgi:hypothetical protein